MTVVYEIDGRLYVNLTNRCPCACVFCIRNGADGAYGSDSLWLEREPTVDEVVDAVNAAGPSRFGELVFCGFGEPTERLDDMLEVIRRVKADFPSLPVRVNTNGLSDLIAGGPTARKFEGLVDVLSISLNAPSAEEYLGLCRPRFGIGAYAAMLRFAEEAKRYVPSVLMSVVASPDMTESKIADCRGICARIGVPLRIRTFASP